MMKFASPEEYLKAGCLFLEGDHKNETVFISLHERTNGFVCETGCADIKICQAYKALLARDPDKPVIVKIPTNAELASKLGISKRQVSKLRKKGLLEATLKEKGIVA
jgi:hypothetical protein